MKLTVFALLAVAMTSARASFDLALIQAKDYDPGTTDARIHRYDPVNRVSLGSFTIGRACTGIAASSARGELYGGDNNGYLKTFDYSNGILKRTRYSGISSISDISLSRDQSKLFICNGGNFIYQYDVASDTFSTVVNQSGAIFTRVVQGASGNLFASNLDLLQIGRYTPFGGGFGYSNGQSYDVGTGSVGQMAVTQLPVGQASSTLYYATQTNGVGTYFLNGSDEFMNNGVNTFAALGFQSVTSVQGAHVGTYLVGPDLTSPGLVRISHRDNTDWPGYSSTIFGINGGARNFAMVLAPEPGVFVGLSLGLVPLLRRKRN